MQARVRGVALVVTLAAWLTVAPVVLGQYYAPTYNPSDLYSQYNSGQFYPPGYNPSDPYSQFQQNYTAGQYYSPYTQPYSYAQPPPGAPGTSAVYGFGGYPSNGPGSAYFGYGYNTPAYQGYGSPLAPPGYGYAYSPYPGSSYYPGYAGAYPGYLSPPNAFTGAATTGGSFSVTATLGAPGSASITWSPVPGAVSYAVYQGVNGTPPTLVTTTPTTTISLPISGGSTVFQVHAIGVNGIEVGISNFSQPVQGTLWGAQFGGYPYNSYSNPGYPGGAPYPGLPNQPSPATSTAFVSPNPAPVTTTAQLVVNVLDINRVPIQGRNVVVTSSRGPSDVITPSSSPVTDVNGRVYFNVRGGSAGPATLTVIVDGIPLQPATISFNPY
jgi:hypothetical protein